MRNFIKLLGIIAFTAVIWMMVSACSGSGTPPDASCTHNWDWITTKHPTVAEEGVETYKCLHCGQTGTTRPVPVTLNVISAVSISITAPVNGAAPNNIATTTDSGYTLGNVSWTPADYSFLGGKEYTAAISLTASSGYTFTGLNSANINGQNGTIINNTGTSASISYTFPATPAKTVTNILIKTQPDNLTYTHNEHLDLTGLVVTLTYDDTTTEDVSAANFIGKNINANPAHGNILARAAHNGKPIAITYGNFSQNTNNLIVNNKAIPSVEINIIAPVMNAIPVTTANGAGDYSIGTVTWLPVHGKFLGGEIYTASVTLTANSGFIFSGVTSADVNGQNNAISNNTGTSITLTHTFSRTILKNVTGLANKSQPSKLTYIHGNHLDLSDLVVTFTYDDGTTEDIAAADFSSKNISTNPADGNTLVRVSHNGKPVVITYGDLKTQTNNLTVNPKVITFSIDPISTVTYTGIAHTPVVTVKDAALLLTLGTDYTVGYTNNINAGTATVTITGVGNYEGSSGSITFIINKASGAIVNAPIVALSTRNSITINSVTAPNNGQTVEYAISTSTTTPVYGWQTGLTFSGLSSGITYYVFARSASNNNYNAGIAISTQIHVDFEPNNEISFGDPSISLFLDGTNLVDGGTTIFNQTAESYTVSISNAGTENKPIPLISGEWVQGFFNSMNTPVCYSFHVENGSTYNIWSTDLTNDGKYRDLYIKTEYENSTNDIIGLGTQFTAYRTGIVKVKVYERWTSSGTGTFGIVFKENDDTQPVLGTNLGTGEYSEIIWYLNGNIVAQGASRTSITLSRHTPGVHQLTVEAIPVGGRKNSGRHNFIIQ